MNLSQDEIQSLLNTDTDAPAEETAAAEAEGPEIMSPEAIAAMLDTASAPPAEESNESVEIMSPEDIAAMLDATTSADPPADNEAEFLDDLMSRADEAPAASAGDAPQTDESPAALPDEMQFDLPDETQPAPQSAPPGEGAHSSVPMIDGMLTPTEIDILGEVGNISMGAVATTMYSLLDRRVSITTPRVHVYKAKEVLDVYRIPFVVATIEYVEGIEGTNLLVLKVEDAALITDLLMGGDGTVEQPIELNEMHISAMSEIMNQMMGASSTSLSKLLRVPVNISPPKSTQVDVGFDPTTLLGEIDMVTKISFDMEIEGLLKSELIQLLPYDVSRDFAKRFEEVGMGVPSGDSAQKPAEQQPAAPPPPPPMAQQAPQPQPLPQAPQPMPMPQAPQPMPQALPTQPLMQDPYQQAPYPAPYPPYPQAPYPQQQYPMPYPTQQGRLVDVHPMQFQSFDNPGPVGESKGMDLVYNIPLQVTVELGKTKKEISEILEFSMGTIIVLDKIAGDPVEIVVNGKLIARGEVVVIDENYGVRITNIING